MEPYLLQDGELNELIVKIPNWEIKSKQIQREFNFANFIEAFAFTVSYTHLTLPTRLPV